MTSIFRGLVIALGTTLMMFVWHWAFGQALLLAFVVEFIIEPWILSKRR